MDALKRAVDALNIDFMGRRRPAMMVSIVAVVLAWAITAVIGPNWGIDFSGGTEVQLRFEESIPIGDLRASLGELEIPSDAIQAVGSDDREFKIRIKDPEFGSGRLREQVVTALKASMGEAWVGDWAQDVRFSAEVGARFSVLYQGERVLPDQVIEKLNGAIPNLKVEEGREDNELVLKFPGLSAQVQEQISSAMAGRAFEVLSVDAVGPKVGAALREQGVLAILATLGLILVYIAFRFDIIYAPGAVVSLAHDVSITVGVFVLLGREFNLPIIGALLTIVGYSLNDTIVVFDRIRENLDRYKREDLSHIINVSLNETLTRTFATSGTTLLAVSPFLILGTEVIQDFVLALFIGVGVGTYSSVFVASPMMLTMERLKPMLQSLIAVEAPEGAAEDDVPDAFLSAAEKRRRERERLGQDDDEVER